MVVEFALLAPAFLLLVFGVLFAGIGVQNYNAVRNLSADVARYAMVQHQAGNTLDNSVIRSYAINTGTGTPYLLKGPQLEAIVTTPTTQRVTGVREVRITITYQMDDMLGFIGIDAPFISYTRPAFLRVNS